jgi:hypothetical protein
VQLFIQVIPQHNVRHGSRESRGHSTTEDKLFEGDRVWGQIERTFSFLCVVQTRKTGTLRPAAGR